MQEHFLDRVVRSSLSGGLPALLAILALISGLVALSFTPREEEPQIVVPMVDVFVSAPGLSAQQVERQVTTPLEKMLAQIPGVEHVYSSSASGGAQATLRFFVGENREEAILNTYNKLYANRDHVPPVVKDWLVRPVEVDDVAILMFALWSDNAELYNDFALRRLADEMATIVQSIPDTSEVKVIGGRYRSIQVYLDPERMAARKITVPDVIAALQQSNQLQSAGHWSFNDQNILLESGDVLRAREELDQLVVSVIDATPVYLQDIASIIDGPSEVESYTWMDFSPEHETAQRRGRNMPMVALSVAKKRGSNAVGVARDVHAMIAELRNTVLPPEVHVQVLRDYGQTANEKVNNLSASLGFAILTVVVFIGIFLGWRPALVVGLAVPICYGVTLGLDMYFGYTINRVTLFALILSLGLLVDDPITGVDNIQRFVLNGRGSINERIVAAISELRVPLVMSTITIILAFIPLAYITGMMGPYMAPMAFNVPVSVITSTFVAFLITPWLSAKLLANSVRADAVDSDTVRDNAFNRIYRRILLPFLASRQRAKWLLWGVFALFITSVLLPAWRTVPLKLLPYDNKNEVQIVIDMDEGASLEATAAVARAVASRVTLLPEVSAVASFVGVPSAIDFNGMVRRYYQRTAPHMADLRLLLVDKTERAQQSHAVVLRLRELLRPMNSDTVSIKVVEVPPGPPVISTLVAELYPANPLVSYQQVQDSAAILVERLSREALVDEIDTSIEADQQRQRFVTDKAKAALSGISTELINQTVAAANSGVVVTWLADAAEASPLPVELRLPQAERESLHDFLRLQLKGRGDIVQQHTPQGLDAAPQLLVALGELGEFQPLQNDKTIYHKDLRPVVYVFAEASGRTPAEIIADLSADRDQPAGESTRVWSYRSYLQSGGGDGWSLPESIELSWSGEGEWRITLRVFRDMGLAFVFALLAIFVVLRMQTASSAISLIIMSSIPLTFIGIMPGFWLINQFGERMVAGAPNPSLFTATAMIGMIALAGIVVRNSLILVEFIGQARARGEALQEALLQAGAVRMRPVVLTAGTTLLGNLIITLDPVFNGLALAIIFGIVASTLFTLLVVPVVYFLVFDKPQQSDVL